MKLTLGTDLNTTLANAAVGFSRESDKWVKVAQEAIAEQEAFGPSYGMVSGTNHDALKATNALRAASVYANAAKHAAHGVLFMSADAMNTRCYMAATRDLRSACLAEGRVVSTEDEIIAEETAWGE